MGLNMFTDALRVQQPTLLHKKRCCLACQSGYNFSGEKTTMPAMPAPADDHHKICPRCQRTALLSAPACDGCGRVYQYRICPQCERSVPVHLPVCTGCGRAAQTSLWTGGIQHALLHHQVAFRLLLVVGLASFALLTLALSRRAVDARAPIPTSQTARLPENFLLGNPDNSTGDPENRDHWLSIRRQFAMSYNDSLRYPNWVGWHLVASDIGTVERGQFRPDPELPDGFMKVTPPDYTSSGYDRGHNLPSKDRSATREDNDAVFVMTNITPQQHGMNAGPWENFESYCRSLTARGNELYLYCGHGFDGPKGKRLGRAQVAVPDFGWKIAVILPEKSGDDLARVTQDTRVVAVRMPNISTISRQDWRRYKVSVAEIEEATGLKFFSALSPDVAEKLRNRVDFQADDPARVPKGEKMHAPSY